MKNHRKNKTNAKAHAMADINKEFGLKNNLACRSKSVVKLLSYKQDIVNI
jgi:hypothetical protein